jgi:steroid delta-isomerase-like uncharacterized protein
MSTEANKELVRRWIDARNRHDLEAAVALFVSDWQARIRRSFASVTDSFPDVHITIEEMIAEGDQVTLRWGFHGTQRGTYRDIPATGKTVDWKGIDIYTVRDGQIVSMMREADSLSVREQLGATVARTEETNEAFIARYFDALRRDKSPETLDAFIAEGELKQHIALYEASFPGYWLEAEDLISEGDKVVVRGKVRGVHAGQLMDIPPTGRDVAVPIFITYRIADGKIVQHWMLVDMLDLLRQIRGAPAVPHAA